MRFWTRIAARTARMSIAVASLGGIVAFPSVAHAYRTAGDLPEFEGTERVGWAKSTIFYSVAGEPPFGIDLDSAAEQLQEAFEVWSAPSCSGFVFEQMGVSNSGAASGDGRNTVEWIHVGWLARGFENSAAVSDVQYRKLDGGWVIDEVDLYINADTATWSYSGDDVEGSTDFSAAMVHEAGHMLGLMHPCELDPTGVLPECGKSHEGVAMHPAYSIESSALSDDDVEGVCFLYPGVTCEITGCAVGEECTRDGCQSICGDRVCTVEESCVRGACKPLSDECFDSDCSCKSDTDCASDQICMGGTCANGGGEIGDPCTSARDCSLANCNVDAYCSKACASPGECDEGWDCQSGSCQTQLATFGSLCSEAAECIGGECVEGFTPEPVCTRRCSEERQDCPMGWECSLVEGRPVCIHAVEAGCGCRVAGSPAAPARIPTMLFLGASALLFFRRPRASVKS